MEQWIEKEAAITAIQQIDTNRAYDDKEDMIEQAIAAIDRQHTIEPCFAFPGDVIVITYKPDEIPVDLMRQEYERISSLFHDNLVIAIPDAVSFKSLSQVQFLELRDSLVSIIDERIGSEI